MADIVNIFISGFNNGLIFIPFAIGIGLIYHNLKEIDVSIDGVIILSGILCAFVWISTRSYWLSLAAGMIAGLFSSILVSLINTKLGVPSLMAGLLFSLMAHTISIALVGESLSLPDTSLLPSSPNSFNISIWHTLVLLGCYLLPLFIYNTHLGLSIKKIGCGVPSNLSYSNSYLKLIAYGTTGSIYGIGASIFVHSNGTAASGSTFVFLVQSLTAYLLVAKLMPLLAYIIDYLDRKVKVNTPRLISEWKSWITLLFSRESLKAPIGAIFLEILVTALIIWNPTDDPQFWKFSLSLVMLIVLATFPDISKTIFAGLPHVSHTTGIRFVDVSFSYSNTAGARRIFSDVNTLFKTGLSILTGPNGSGKTTLLKLISGLANPEKGLIIYANRNLVDIPVHKRPVFMLMQNPMNTLVSDMKVFENLFLSYRSISHLSFINGSSVIKDLRAKLTLSNIQINWDESDRIWQTPVNLLSGGEAYCIAIYCAVLSGCKIILADEPTTGLDDRNYQMVRSVLNSLTTSSDCTLIIVTHDERLKDMTSSKYVIRDNRIVEHSEWWDARYRDTFFPAVYKYGDYSVEGHLNSKPLDLHSRTQREIEIIKHHLGGVRGNHILDCPCGYGRHSIALAKIGALMKGIDLCPEFIADAKQLADLSLHKIVQPEFSVGDMRHLPFAANTFHAVINMFLAFGFFDDDGNTATLAEFFRVLKPGGKLLIHTDVNPDQVKQGRYGDRSTRTLADGKKLQIQESVVNDRLEGTWTILSGQGETLAKQRYSVRIYTHDELFKLLQDVGFGIVSKHFPSDSRDQEVVYIAEKTTHKKNKAIVAK